MKDSSLERVKLTISLVKLTTNMSRSMLHLSLSSFLKFIKFSISSDGFALPLK